MGFITASRSSNEQIKTQQPSQDSSEKGNFDKKNNHEPRKEVPKSVTKIKRNETKGIDDNVLKTYKPIGVSIIILLIPITLLIMYKIFHWMEKGIEEKKMKKVINLFGVNKTTKTFINSTYGKNRMQIIINSSSQKKRLKNQ
ncbi:hypothetical protein YYC_05804 [Plasmodium yoelii 17X]|uniref:Uncharacterized protein n=2 Tax=Plasmodium yoelii TaxID=5861 RepID=Q7RQB5_PLAYO|nr:hypothetical protein [Plasmodium yoelii yoelii]ETB56375.1 hypothetical protein YYC_05804 [Plasmodium yoelii 17X]